MKTAICAAFAATLAATPASAAVIVEWSGQADPSDTSIFQLLSSNLNGNVPTLVDKQAFRLDVFVTGPTDNLTVSALLAFRINEFIDGIPTGGGSGFGPSPVTLIGPGHWTGTFVSQNPPFVVTPGIYRLRLSALVGAQIDRVGFQRGPAYSYRFVISSAPEPASWAMMIAGFGMLGAAARRSSRPALARA